MVKAWPVPRIACIASNSGRDSFLRDIFLVLLVILCYYLRLRTKGYQ